ncbi:MAG: putative NEK protein kinase, partial [Streblomastix strix]
MGCSSSANRVSDTSTLISKELNINDLNDNNYETIEMLAGNSYAQTYLAKQNSSGKFVILKKVKLLDTYQDQNGYNMVYEYCEGGNLRTTMKESRSLSDQILMNRIWDIFIQIILALDFIHSRNATHLNLKPENIFVMSDGRVKLNDFRNEHDLIGNNQSMSIWRRSYSSPEFISMQRLTSQSDIYSVGAIMYESVSGRHPFVADKEAEMIEKVKNCELSSEFPSFVPTEMQELIIQMLSYDPTSRPTVKTILNHKKIRELLGTSEQSEDDAKIGYIAPKFIIPDKILGSSNNNKFTHTNASNVNATISIDPIIKNGAVRIDFEFDKHDMNVFYIGVADASVIFEADKQPHEDRNDRKTVRYSSHGFISHYLSGDCVSGNKSFNKTHKVSAEVDMNSTPRTLRFFVSDDEQVNQIVNIPAAIRFF